MRFLKYFFLTFVIVFAACYLVGLAVPSPAYDVQYDRDYRYSPSLADAVRDFGYTPLSLPDSLLMCTMVDGKPVACWYMPSGSVVLIPIPESAPVDSF